jgi:serine/threonine-protein kinase
LGKYLLLRRIAVGGMGEIFYGKIGGVEGFEREVAIKKMLPHLSDDRAFINQMINEAKLTVQLNHPNIVQVHDLAREKGEYYIAMEYVPGVTVGQLLERCSLDNTHLPYEVAIHITMQTLQGLAYAHDLRDAHGESMQILHRDITPQNIMVTRNAWVKITDFGIAKARNEISTTTPGVIKGKLGYIAPEQLAGQEADQRIDLFCAAIILWESLATRRLFKGIDEIDTFRLIAQCAIPKLSDFRDDVPPEIERALRVGLARSPNDRYKSADEFFHALNMSIFPNTADEYAGLAKRYFADHPEFFESVESTPNANTNTNDLTVEMSTTSREEKMIDILELTAVRGVSRRRRLVVPAVIAATVLLLAVAALVLRDNLRAWLNPAEPLTLEEVELAIHGERSRLVACYADADRELPTLSARLTIPSTGGVAEAVLSPAEGLGAAGPCVTGVLTELKFRPHRDLVFTAEVELPPRPKKDPPSRTRERTKKAAPPSSAVAPRRPSAAKPTKKVDAIKAQVTAAVQRVSGAVAACAGQFSGLPNPPKKLVVTVDASAAGTVTSVGISPPPGSDEAQKCLVRAVNKLRLPKREAPYKFSFDVSLK